MIMSRRVRLPLFRNTATFCCLVGILVQRYEGSHLYLPTPPWRKRSRKRLRRKQSATTRQQRREIPTLTFPAWKGKSKILPGSRKGDRQILNTCWLRWLG